METKVIIEEVADRLSCLNNVFSVNSYHKNPDRHGQDSGQVGWKYDRTDAWNYSAGQVSINNGVVFIPNVGYFTPKPLTTDAVWDLIFKHFPDLR